MKEVTADRRWSRVERWLPLVWLAVVGPLVVLRVWGLFSGAFDLGYYVHALRTVMRDGIGAGSSLLGIGVLEDHFAPGVLLLAPLSLVPSAQYLFVLVQAGAVAWSIAIGSSTLRALGVDDVRARSLLLIGYSVAPPLMFAVWFDFHPSLLAAPFVMLAIRSLARGDAKAGVIAGLSASIMREDVAMLVVLIGLYAWLKRRPGGVVIAGSALVVGLIGVAFTASHGWFSQIAWSYLDPTRPLWSLSTALRLMWVRGLIAAVVLAVILPWVFFGKWKAGPFFLGVLWALPLLISAHPATKVPDFHYYWPLALTGLWSTAGAVGSDDVTQHTGSRLPIVAGLLASLLCGPFGAGWLASWTPSAPRVVREVVADHDQVSLAHALVGCLPTDLAVSVASPLVPLVTERDTLFVYPQPFEAFYSFPGLPPLTRERPAGKPALVVSPTTVALVEGNRSFPLASGRLPSPTDVGYRLVADSEWYRVWAERGMDPARQTTIAGCLGARGLHTQAGRGQ